MPSQDSTEVSKTEAYYTARLAESGIPEHMHGGMLLYLLHGIPPGSFMTAVLMNDLREACSRADDTNKVALWNYVAFLYNYAPSSAWGSKERVIEWVDGFRRQHAEIERVP